ncbi:MAG TPA: FAD-dependent oxidoreductase [Gammaproteobacteria bacterium]|nr:FAD-dependent oxidoreductase [Gammaproteobacteria bacterium]
MSDPWASPEIPRFILKWMGKEDSPFLLRPAALPGLFSWGIKFLRQCNQTAWAENAAVIYRLCSYSKETLNQLVADTGIEYDGSRLGTLHLFRDQLSIEVTKRVAETLGAMGLHYELLDEAGCIELEPSLRSQKGLIAGGIHYPDDEAGDARLFSQRLAQYCSNNGVTVRYGESIKRIETLNGAVSAVVTDTETIAADTCVVAMGNESNSVLRPLGIRLPIYPVKGYSLTFPVGQWNGAPMIPMADTGRHIGITRLGDRIRVAGTAEFAGNDRSLNPKRIGNLRRFFLDVFPDYPDPSAGEGWTGFRPMTPDGIPYLGPTPVQGLYLNTGHGHLGWTMSCGSGQALAQLISGATGDLDLTGMTLASR